MYHCTLVRPTAQNMPKHKHNAIVIGGPHQRMRISMQELHNVRKGTAVVVYLVI